MTKTETQTSIDVLEETLAALRCCTQSFGCNSECPFYPDAQHYEAAPEAFCQGRMAGHVRFVLERLKEAE